MSMTTEIDALAIKAVAELRDGIGTEMQRDRDMRHILGLAIDRIRTALSTPAARMPAGEVAQDLRSALEPCPFCGGDGLSHRVPSGWRVSCKNCDAQPRPGLPSNTEADAIAAWNRRAALASDTNGNGGDHLDGVSARFIVNTAEAKLTSREDMRTALSLCASAARKALAQPAENAKGGEVTQCDRELYARIAPDLCALIHNGDLDDLAEMRAIVGHRLAHPPAAEPVGLREDVAIAIYGASAAELDEAPPWHHVYPETQRVYRNMADAALSTPARTDDAAPTVKQSLTVEITQADADAANAWMRENVGNEGAPGSLCAAFAAHRVAALSPAPDRGDVDAERIERAAEWLHNEGGFDDAWPNHTWPEHPSDTGQRDGGFVKIVPSDVQAKFREVATRMLRVFPSALKPADATPAGEAG